MPRPRPRRKILPDTHFHHSAGSGVDHNLARSWLGLPPGPWPPDHYALLGLPRGQSDPAAVEPLVLDRMDRLRRHQLLHPELVTEGMNRLAQALITLTDPAAKSLYDAELGIAAAAPQKPAAIKPRPRPEEPARAAPVVIARPVIDDVFPDDVPVGLPANADDTLELQIPSFEVVEAKEPRAGNLVVSDQEVLDLPKAKFGPAAVDAGVVEAVPVGLRRDEAPERHRWVYARLAMMRRAMRAWQALGPVVADTEDRLDRPGRVLILLEAVARVRPVLPNLRGIVGGVGEPGGVVAAVVNQPILLNTFRRLLPDQRQAVADDWACAHAELRREYQRLRHLARRGKGERAGPVSSEHLGRWFRDNPEWVLVVLVVLAIFIALVRGSAGS